MFRSHCNPIVKTIYSTVSNSLRKHPFLLALRGWETSLAAKSVEKQMFSQAM